MSDCIFSIDIQDGLIAGVVLQPQAGQYVISGWGIVEAGERSQEQALSQLIKQVGFTGGECRISLAAERFFFNNLTLPFSESKKIDQVLPFEIEDSSPLKSNDLIIDAIYNRLEGKKTDVIAVMLKRDILAGLLRVLDKLGLDPDILTISNVEIAERLAQQTENKKDFILLHVGPAKVAMIIVLDGRVVLIRPLDFDSGGTGAQCRLGEDLGRIAAARPDALPSAFKSLELSIEQTLKATRVQFKPLAVYLSGPCAHLAGLPEYLKDSLAAEIRQCDVLGNQVKIQSVSAHNGRWIPEIMNQALALGLRSKKEKNGLNFRKGEFGRRGTLKYRRLLPGRPGLVAGIAVVLLVCFLGYDFFSLKMTEKRLTNRIQTIFSNTLPGVSKSVDPVAQVQAEVNRMQYNGGQGIQYGYRALELLLEISKRIPLSTRVRMTQMIMNDKGVRLKGVTDTFNTVDKIKNELEQSAFFNSVAITSANLSSQGNGIHFDMTLQLKSP